MIPQAEACRRLREYVYSRWKYQTIAAAQLGCQQGRLSEMIAGKRPIPGWLLREIGLEKRRVSGPCCAACGQRKSAWVYYEDAA